MNQNYYTNNPYSMGANQNFPPLSQSGSGGYPDAAMGNMGMMKQNQMNIGKLNDPMGFAGPSWGNLKSPSLTQNASDDSNSTNLQSSKKLSYNSGIFVPSMRSNANTSQIPEQSHVNSAPGFMQPHVQNPMMPQGLQLPPGTSSTYAYPQNVNQHSAMGMGKYPQNLFNNTNPQSPSPSLNFNMGGPNSYINTNPNSLPSGIISGDSFHSSMIYSNKSANSSFMGSGSNLSFPSSGLSSIDNSFQSYDTPLNYESEKEYDKIVESIANLKYAEKREEALQDLSKKRETFNSLARLLWYSVGTVAILLQEIVAIYPYLSPPNLSQIVSNKVCNVLGLLQCLALHSETRAHFLNAHIPLFLYPFLNTSSKSKPFENLRVTSLGVIGALVKGDDSEAINFLVQTEIIPLCLRIMKRGLELSRTVATFIVQKILLDQNGLNYICQTVDRFYAVLSVLNQMIDDLVTNNKDDQRLLRHIIRCYHRLSDNQKANDALRKTLPQALRDPEQTLITEDAVKRWHTQLLQNLGLITNYN